MIRYKNFTQSLTAIETLLIPIKPMSLLQRNAKFFYFLYRPVVMTINSYDLIVRYIALDVPKERYTVAKYVYLFEELPLENEDYTYPETEISVSIIEDNSVLRAVYFYESSGVLVAGGNVDKEIKEVIIDNFY